MQITTKDTKETFLIISSHPLLAISALADRIMGIQQSYYTWYFKIPEKKLTPELLEVLADYEYSQTYENGVVNITIKNTNYVKSVIKNTSDGFRREVTYMYSFTQRQKPVALSTLLNVYGYTADADTTEKAVIVEFVDDVEYLAEWEAGGINWLFGARRGEKCTIAKDVEMIDGELITQGTNNNPCMTIKTGTMIAINVPAYYAAKLVEIDDCCWRIKYE